MRNKAVMAGIAGLSFSTIGLASVQTFSTPGSHTYTVPPGVTSIQIEVAGAGGGAGSGVSVPDEFGMPLELVGTFPGGSGGAGARVTATLAVAPGDVIQMVVAGAGRGGTLHRSSAPVGTGAGGSGSGAGGATANADDPAAGTRSLTGGGGGGASALSLGGTYVRAGGGGGGGGGHKNQATFSHGEPGAAALHPAVATADCAHPADGLEGTLSPATIASMSYQHTGSGGGGGGGYDGPGDTGVGLGGETPALVFGDGLPVVEFAPTGGGGGGSCYLVGSKALSGIASDGSGGAGATADPAPPSIWAVNMMTDAELPAPIDGTDGWVRLTVPEAAPAPVPGLGVWGLVSLSSLLLGFAGWRGRARGSSRSGQRWRG